MKSHPHVLVLLYDYHHKIQIKRLETWISHVSDVAVILLLRSVCACLRPTGKQGMQKYTRFIEKRGEEGMAHGTSSELFFASLRKHKEKGNTH